MNATKRLVYASAMAALAALSCGLWAAEPTSKREPTLAKKVRPDRLSVEQLGEMLANLGLNPKADKNENGEVVGYALEFQSGTWTIHHWVHLSRDQSTIWINSNLVPINGSAAVSPEALLQLLEKNNEFWPSYVFFAKEAKRLRLAMPVKNTDVRPVEMRQEIDTFTDHVKVLIERYEKESKLVKGE